MTKYFKCSDRELTVLLKQGSHNAFTEIFNRYNSLMYSHACNKLRSPSDARDIVQEMFTRLWDRREELEVGNNLPGYLYTVVRNQIFNFIKHQKVVTGYAETFCKINEENSATTDYLIRSKQFEAMIQAEIDALPPRMRQVFELRRNENLSNKEVGLRLGISELTAADQMKKAMKQLKTRIGLILIIACIMDNCL